MKTVPALLTLAALFAPVGAVAQTSGYYVATPVATPGKPEVITRSTLWRSHGPVYVASRAPERPAILCSLLARQAGALSSFLVDGNPLDADKLAQCNAKVTPQVVAAK